MKGEQCFRNECGNWSPGPLWEMWVAIRWRMLMALQLQSSDLVWLFFSIGRRMWLKSFTMSWHCPAKRKKVVKSRQKTNIFRTGVYWSQWMEKSWRMFKAVLSLPAWEGRWPIILPVIWHHDTSTSLKCLACFSSSKRKSEDILPRAVLIKQLNTWQLLHLNALNTSCCCYLIKKNFILSTKGSYSQENSWPQKKTTEKKNYKDQRESRFLRGKDE